LQTGCYLNFDHATDNANGCAAVALIARISITNIFYLLKVRCV